MECISEKATIPLIKRVLHTFEVPEEFRISQETTFNSAKFDNMPKNKDLSITM